MITYAPLIPNNGTFLKATITHIWSTKEYMLFVTKFTINVQPQTSVTQFFVIRYIVSRLGEINDGADHLFIGAD